MLKLVFPIEKKKIADDLNINLKNYYEFNEEFEFKGIKHNLPFGKFKFFNKLLFYNKSLSLV